MSSGFSLNMHMLIFGRGMDIFWNCMFLVANLVTNFQDLVAKVENLVALMPVLGTISRPEINDDDYQSKSQQSNRYGTASNMVFSVVANCRLPVKFTS